MLRITNAMIKAIAVPIPNCTMASIPDTAFEMNAAADDATASTSAGNTAANPIGYESARLCPST